MRKSIKLFQINNLCISAGRATRACSISPGENVHPTRGGGWKGVQSFEKNPYILLYCCSNRQQAGRRANNVRHCRGYWIKRLFRRNFSRFIGCFQRISVPLWAIVVRKAKREGNGFTNSREMVSPTNLIW